MEGVTPAEELVGQLADNLAEAMTAAGEFHPATIVDARQRTLREIVARRGQPRFRRDLLNAYGSRCAITGCDVVDALEAAHIIGYLGAATNNPVNGLLLRADIHTLFDLRLFAINVATGTVLLAPQLQGTHYGSLQGQNVTFPANPILRPSVAALNQQRAEAGL
jgi:predicted restriction endonuclease